MNAIEIYHPKKTPKTPLTSCTYFKVLKDSDQYFGVTNLQTKHNRMFTPMSDVFLQYDITPCQATLDATSIGCVPLIQYHHRSAQMIH